MTGGQPCSENVASAESTNSLGRDADGILGYLGPRRARFRGNRPDTPGALQPALFWAAMWRNIRRTLGIVALRVMRTEIIAMRDVITRGGLAPGPVRT